MNTELIFRLLAGLAYAVAITVVWTYRRKAQAGERYDLSQEGWPLALTLRLGGLALWLFPPIYALFPGWVDWAGLKLPAALRWAATAVALIAVPPFAAWAQRHLGRNVTTTVVTKEGHQLVTSGPYRWIRHPLYSAGMAFFLSLAILTSNWIPLLASVVVFLALLARLPKEEARLLERFGDDAPTRAARAASCHGSGVRLQAHQAVTCLDSLSKATCQGSRWTPPQVGFIKLSG